MPHISNIYIFRERRCFRPTSVTRRGVGRGGRPPVLKNFRANSIFQGKRKLLKNPEYKKSTFNTVISGHPQFFRASASCSKILCVKSTFNTVKNSRATVFSGQAQVAQNSWIIKNILNTEKNFRAPSVFQGKRKLFKKSECKKYLP